MSASSLDGIVVLDLTRVLAGPLCTQYLSDLGATVIKIEPLGVGDETRGWPPFGPDGSAIFANFNRNKKSMAVDLKSSEGRALVHRLARTADVVVENWRMLAAAPGLTDEQKAAISADVEKLAKSAAWQDVLKTKGWQDTYLSGDAFDKQLNADITATESILKEIGLVQ